MDAWIASLSSLFYFHITISQFRSSDMSSTASFRREPCGKVVEAKPRLQVYCTTLYGRRYTHRVPRRLGHCMVHTRYHESTERSGWAERRIELLLKLARPSHGVRNGTCSLWGDRVHRSWGGGATSGPGAPIGGCDERHDRSGTAVHPEAGRTSGEFQVPRATYRVEPVR